MQINTPYVDLTSSQTITGTKTFNTVNILNTLNQNGGSLEVMGRTLVSATGTLPLSANVLADATVGNITLTLPVAATSASCRLVITKFDASANTVTIQPQAGGTIGGAASVVLAARYQSITLLNINVQVAGAWVVVGKT